MSRPDGTIGSALANGRTPKLPRRVRESARIKLDVISNELHASDWLAGLGGITETWCRVERETRDETRPWPCAMVAMVAGFRSTGMAAACPSDVVVTR
jgi:hypothetical protein